MFDFMTVARALTDENRVRILMALCEYEMCVCQVTGFLDLAPSTTSKHLSILKQARLIESRKKGRWVHYRLADTQTASPVVRDALLWLSAAVGNSSVVREDAQRIARILEQERQLFGCVDEESCHSLEIHSVSEAELPTDPSSEN
jgi:Predicted transcriptional regulators